MQINGSSNEIRSKIKKKCKLQSSKSFKNDLKQIQKPKQILSQILQIDYVKQTKPQSLKVTQFQTYGSLAQCQIRQIFKKQISRQSLRSLLIDAMKLCYLYNPVMQAIQSQINLKTSVEEYNIQTLLQIILHGKFYQFLQSKTQQTKFLVNNRSTEVNVKTIISGILTFMTNKLTIQNISDALLFYRLQQALHHTAPFGLPFQFEKIIKAMKKIDRNITLEKFAKWEKKMNAIQKNRKFLEPYHFIYLISLSEPASKKRTNFFQIDRKQSTINNKFQKQTQILNIMKQKTTLAEFQKRKVSWKNQVKIRGLSFQQPSQKQKIQKINSQYQNIRKRVLSHKRVKSAYVKNEARKIVQQQLKQNNQLQNQYLLQLCFTKKQQPKQRILLKRHLKKSKIKYEIMRDKQQKEQKFKAFYNKELKIFIKASQQAHNMRQSQTVNNNNYSNNNNNNNDNINNSPPSAMKDVVRQSLQTYHQHYIPATSTQFTQYPRQQQVLKQKQKQNEKQNQKHKNKNKNKHKQNTNQNQNQTQNCDDYFQQMDVYAHHLKTLNLIKTVWRSCNDDNLTIY